MINMGILLRTLWICCAAVVIPTRPSHQNERTFSLSLASLETVDPWGGTQTQKIVRESIESARLWPNLFSLRLSPSLSPSLPRSLTPLSLDSVVIKLSWI